MVGQGGRVGGAEFFVHLIAGIAVAATMPGKIFVNYRRDDKRSTAARIRDRLAASFGDANIFLDLDNGGPRTHDVSTPRLANRLRAPTASR
jgi:hypothetical protein